MRVTRSSPCWEPTVTVTSSGWAAMPSSLITSQMASRIIGSPWPEPYCMARVPVVERPARPRVEPTDVERQVGDVGHPAGQRDDLGPVGHGEQGADGRGGHPVGAGGVAVDVVVQPGVAPRRAGRPHSRSRASPRGRSWGEVFRSPAKGASSTPAAHAVPDPAPRASVGVDWCRRPTAYDGRMRRDHLGWVAAPRALVALARRGGGLRVCASVSCWASPGRGRRRPTLPPRGSDLMASRRSAR